MDVRGCIADNVQCKQVQRHKARGQCGRRTMENICKSVLKDNLLSLLESKTKQMIQRKLFERGTNTSSGHRIHQRKDNKQNSKGGQKDIKGLKTEQKINPIVCYPISNKICCKNKGVFDAIIYLCSILHHLNFVVSLQHRSIFRGRNKVALDVPSYECPPRRNGSRPIVVQHQQI